MPLYYIYIFFVTNTRCVQSRTVYKIFVALSSFAGYINAAGLEKVKIGTRDKCDYTQRKIHTGLRARNIALAEKSKKCTKRVSELSTTHLADCIVYGEKSRNA